MKPFVKGRNATFKKMANSFFSDEVLDFLLVDTPPGTSDEHLSIVQYLAEAGIKERSRPVAVVSLLAKLVLKGSGCSTAVELRPSEQNSKSRGLDSPRCWAFFFFDPQ